MQVQISREHLTKGLIPIIRIFVGYLPDGIWTSSILSEAEKYELAILVALGFLIGFGTGTFNYGPWPMQIRIISVTLFFGLFQYPSNFIAAYFE